MKEQVYIFDTTLRDGEQSPGISLNAEEKVCIATQLSDVGVDIIEAGFPVSSQADFEAVEAVATAFKAIPETTVCGLSRTALHDIDRCWEAIEPAASRRIHTFIATSAIHMEHKLRMTPEQVMRETARAVSHAKTYTDDVEFSAEDAVRSDIDFLCNVLQVAIDNGATTINIPDTVGFAQPEEFADRIRAVKQRVIGAYTLSTHCHNDLGLAVANTLAGVKAGARQVEVAVNGIGERAGNAALEEVVMNIQARSDYFPGVFTGIDTTQLLDTSRLVASKTGYPVQFNKAIVGRNAFNHEAGIHQDGVLKARETYEWMDAASVGQRGKLEIGKHSGSRAVASRLEALGMNWHNVAEIRDACKQVSAEKGRQLSDVEIEKVAAEIADVKLHDHLRITSIDTRGHDETSKAVIDCFIGDSPYRLVGENHGEIGAAAQAIANYFEGYGIRDWESFEAGEEGAGATGAVRFEVTTAEGICVSTYAEGRNVVHATVKAYAAAINTIVRIQERLS